MAEAGFNKCLGNKEVLALAFGAMIGWGWVVLIGDWLGLAGTFGAIIAFAVGGLAVTLIGLTYAELAAAMPVTGGASVFTFRALGLTASFVCTWALILGYVSVVAFEAVAFPTVLEYLIPWYKAGYLWSVAGWDVYFTWAMVGILGSIVMTWINLRGVESAAAFQTIVTVLIVIAGVGLVAAGVTLGDSANLEPLFTGGVAGMFAVLIMTPFMFVGFDVIPQAAAEIDLPRKQIGRLLILSVGMAVIWYMAVIFAASMGLHAEAVAGSSLVAADAMTALVGHSAGGTIVVLAGLGGIITSWNAFYIGGSRAIYSMARAGMLPAFLAKLHPKHGTPVNAVLLIGILSTAAPLFGRKALVWLVDAGGLAIVVAYGLVSLSFVVLRRREPAMPRPFLVANGLLVGWAATLLSLFLALLYLPPSPSALVWPYEWAIVGFWVALGLVFFAWTRSTQLAQATSTFGAVLASAQAEASPAK